MKGILLVVTVVVVTFRRGVELMWSGRGLDGVGGALGLLVDVALEALVSDWMFPETHGRPL